MLFFRVQNVILPIHLIVLYLKKNILIYIIQAINHTLH